MRVSHIYDSSFVLQALLHKLEQNEEIIVKEIAVFYNYAVSTIYKLLKKIDLNFVRIDSNFKIVRVGSGKYKLFNSSVILSEEKEK